MQTMSKIKQFISRHKTFLIASHHNPDADAIASSLSMALILKALGKKATVLNEDPVPAWLRFLPQTNTVKTAARTKAFDYDAVIILDCGDKERIGGVAKLLIKGKPVLNIDHHVTNKHFGDLNWVTPISSSTCEIIYDLAEYLKVAMTKPMAALLYAGIMTDTGSFRYDNTSVRVHDICAALMRFGINAQDFYDRLYVGIPVADMKQFVALIHHAELSLKGKVYCVSLFKKTKDAFSNSFDLKDKLFWFLRSVEGIEVIVILTELGSKETRINLRSQGKFNVAKLATQFNGGGHAKASGAKMAANVAQTKKAVVAAIAAQLRG